MNLKTQAKILRVLQEKQFHRLGSDRIIRVDVRVIATTNKNLEEEIEKGNFREDLFYRLNVVPIQVPSLRERIGDLPLLAETFLSEFSGKSKSHRKTISPEALEALSKYAWPGNVRELKNLIERLTLTVLDEIININHLPRDYHPSESGQKWDSLEEILEIQNIKEAREAFENAFIQKKLEENDHDFEKTASVIGTQKSYIRKWQKKQKK